jgi:glycogen operon protein
MLTTLLLSFGVPLLVAGDELGRTQGGNNNAYCQDNDTSWLDWADIDTELLAYCKNLIALRAAHPVFRRRRFLTGAAASHLRWFTPGGTQMTGADWSDPSALAVAIFLDGRVDPDRASDGAPMVDDDFLVLVNAWWQPLDFTIPAGREGATWHLELDSYDPAAAVAAKPRSAGEHVTVGPRSMSVYRAPSQLTAVQTQRADRL